jgi:hypothetical protein
MDTYVAPYHTRIFRWDGSGAAAVELGNLGTNVYPLSSTSTAHAAAINDAGTAAGYAKKWDGSVDKGYRAVRWDSSVAAATELGNLGTDPSGVTHSMAYAINDAGVAVGVARKYDGSGVDMGLRAVRWDASSTAAVELGNLGANIRGDMRIVPFAVNNAGTAVGHVAIHDDADNIVDARAVRWDASGAATKLGNLGTDAADNTITSARAINAAGTAIGYSSKYDDSGNYMGYRAVRWEASGTAATELDNLGADPSGTATPIAINDAGTIVGTGTKFNSFDRAAIRWDASGTAATQLGNLGTDQYIGPSDINNAGIAVGFAAKYDNSGTRYLGQRAVYWGLDGAAVDLNTLIDPSIGWTLYKATDISDTGWIAGAGFVDPDGAGGQASFRRLFLMHVPATAVGAPGDYNHNGAVDAADYIVWRKTEGSVNGYNEWRANFGASFGPGSGATIPSAVPLSATVPEPATLVLMLLTAIAISLGRHTRAQPVSKLVRASDMPLIHPV